MSTTGCNIPEDWKLQQRRCEDLKLCGAVLGLYPTGATSRSRLVAPVGYKSYSFLCQPDLFTFHYETRLQTQNSWVSAGQRRPSLRSVCRSQPYVLNSWSTLNMSPCYWLVKHGGQVEWPFNHHFLTLNMYSKNRLWGKMTIIQTSKYKAQIVRYVWITKINFAGNWLISINQARFKVSATV